MSNFGDYSGEELFKLEFEDRKFLIRDMLKEKDGVVIVGAEKTGKSLITLQMICSLTSQHAFLDEFEVERPCRVTYVAIEGELSDIRKRLERMMKAVDFNKENFQIIYSEPLQLNFQPAMKEIIRRIEKCHKPDVIILDPLYFCFDGSISDDSVVRAFLGNIRRLKEHFGCAIILVHHTHKIKFDADGEIVDEGDNAIFGSNALKWWPDHILLLSYNQKTGKRVFSCHTQRGGDINRQVVLNLNQPDPLYFEKTDTVYHDKAPLILDCLKRHNDRGRTAGEVMKELNISNGAFYRDAKKLLLENKIEKQWQKRPVLYSLKVE